MNPLYLQAAAALTPADYPILHNHLVGTAAVSAPSRRRTRISAASAGIPEPDQPEVNPRQTGDAAAENASTCSDNDSRRRQHIPHDWPLVGAVLTADYYGQQYRAVVIPAKKKLQSGRQLKIESGPAGGEICDSLSAAMIVATEAQRRKMNLRRKGVANGWDFWQWEGK